MSHYNSTLKGILSVIFASIIWGTTGTAASLIPDVNPMATGAFAMGLGGILLVWNARKSLIRDKKCLLTNLKVLLIGSISVAIYPLAFYTSMRLSGVAIGTLISIASAPFFTAILERLISKKSISLQWIISFVIGVLGIALMTFGKQNTDTTTNSITIQVLGIVLALLAALTYATYSWSARQMIEQGVSSKSSMAGMFGVAAFFLLPSLYFTGENVLSDIQHISILVYMAVIPMFIGYLCFGYGLKQIDASKATLITLLEPAVATLFAVSIVGEKFDDIGWYGMVLIVCCLLLQIIKWPSARNESQNLISE